MLFNCFARFVSDIILISRMCEHTKRNYSSSRSNVISLLSQSHHSLAACPYSPRNLDGEDPLPDRLQVQFHHQQNYHWLDFKEQSTPNWPNPIERDYLQGAERDRIEERLARFQILIIFPDNLLSASSSSYQDHQNPPRDLHSSWLIPPAIPPHQHHCASTFYTVQGE